MHTLRNQFPFPKSLPKIDLPVNLSVVGVLDLFLIFPPLPSRFPILIFPRRGLENTSHNQQLYYTVHDYGKKFIQNTCHQCFLYQDAIHPCQGFLIFLVYRFFLYKKILALEMGVIWPILSYSKLR